MKNINEKEIFIGIQKALENSTELIEEAKILIQHKKFSRAFALLQFSIEELGKVGILNKLWLALEIDDQVDYSTIEDDFKNHKAKTKSALLIDLMVCNSMKKSGKDIKEFLESTRIQSENLDKINNTKNESLYVSIKNNKFHKPSEIISEEMVDTHLFWANIRNLAVYQIHKGLIENKEVVKEEIKKIIAEGKEEEYIDKINKELES